MYLIQKNSQITNDFSSWVFFLLNLVKTNDYHDLLGYEEPPKKNYPVLPWCYTSYELHLYIPLSDDNDLSPFQKRYNLYPMPGINKWMVVHKIKFL